MSIENVRVEQEHIPVPATGPYFVGKPNNHDAGSSDGDLVQLNRFKDWVSQAKQAWAETRAEMATDEAYKDGDQWTDSERAALEERGQAPLVFNLCRQSIKWLTGTERRTRVDSKVIPRKKEFADAAQKKTNLMKYVSDVNRSPFRVSKEFERATTAGLGWLIESVNPDPSEDVVELRGMSWRYIWLDPFSREDDISDARYVFIEKYIDLDLAQQLFPEKARALATAAENMLLTVGEEMDELLVNPYLYDRTGDHVYVAGEESWNSVGRRQRVKIVSMWYQDPIKCQVMHGDGAWDGAIYNEDDETMRWLVESGQADLNEAVKMVVHHGIFCDNILLKQGGLSPYWHNMYPLTPIWCYRRESDGMPYGVIRGMRDPQDDYNKRRSKAQHLLSTQRTIMDEGAVDDVEEYRQEVARPDAVIEKKKNHDLKIDTQHTLAAQHIDMMHDSSNFIQMASGVTDELMGRDTNATSGKAVMARQNQGVATTMDIFDQLRQSLQISGEKQLRLIEQYIDEDLTVRVIGDRGKASFEDVPADDVFFNKADFIVDEQAFQESTRKAMFETLMEMIKQMDSQVAMQLLDLVFDLSDIPQREEIVARIRKINGQTDPDRELTPEEEQAIAEQQKQQQEIEMRQIEANLQKLEGQAKEAIAKGNKQMAEAIYARLKTVRESLDVADILVTAPELGPVADEINDDVSRS